jgi:hypothetical protein
MMTFNECDVFNKRGMRNHFLPSVHMQHRVRPTCFLVLLLRLLLLLVLLLLLYIHVISL